MMINLDKITIDGSTKKVFPVVPGQSFTSLPSRGILQMLDDLKVGGLLYHQGGAQYCLMLHDGIELLDKQSAESIKTVRQRSCEMYRDNAQYGGEIESDDEYELGSHTNETRNNKLRPRYNQGSSAKSIASTKKAPAAQNKT